MSVLAKQSFSLSGHRTSVALEPDRARIALHLANSLMLVTALNPHIGYDRAVAIGKRALHRNITLKQAGVELGFVTEAEFDRWVRPEAMIAPGASEGGGGEGGG